MHGAPGSIALGGFGRVLDTFQVLTTKFAQDRGVEGATWSIADLAIGSAVAEAAIDLPDDAQGFANEIATSIDALRTDATIPAGMPLAALPSIQRLGAESRGHPVRLEVLDGGLTVDIGPEVAENARMAAKARRRSLGGFYGRIEPLDLRRKRGRFGLRDEFSHRWIPCEATDDVFEKAKALVGERVYVAGVIIENAARQPLRIEVEEVDPKPWETGSIAGFVGEADRDAPDAARLVRSDRDEW